MTVRNGTHIPDANVSLEYQTVTMTQDRGTRITVDAMDRDETQGLLDVSKLMSKFQREKSNSGGGCIPILHYRTALCKK